jgi:hypothetical protein
MSWKDAFKYAKGIAGNNGVDAAKKDLRSDDGLPLGGRIGGLIKLQMSPFIRASASGSLITTPATPDMLIRAVSRVRLNLGGKLYRYYLATGDDDAEQESFLQLYVNDKDDVAETLYCTRLTRIIPQSEDEQAAFTGEGGAGLGEKTYSLWKEQLAGLGWSAAALQDVFGEEESIDYQRDAGDPSEDFVSPFTGTETRVDDAIGEHGLKQDIYFMPYVRNFGSAADGTEYLLITTEIVESQDGDPSKRAIHVDFMISIPLEKERFTIQ